MVSGRHNLTILRKCFTAMVHTLQASADRLDGKDRAEVQGVLHNVTTFRFVATVHFFCDALLPLHILSLALQPQVLTISRIESAYIAAKLSLETILNSELTNKDNCPNFLQFVSDLKAGEVASRFVRELDGCNLSDPDAIQAALAPAIVILLDTVAYPFVRALLRYLKASFEYSENIKQLLAVECVVFPAGLKSLARRQNRAVGNQRTVLPIESPAEELEFSSALDLVCTVLNVSDDNKCILQSEHSTYRIHCMAIQQSRIQKSEPLLQTVGDLRLELGLLTYIQDVCPLTFELLDLMVSAPTASVEGERGFSEMKLYLTRLRSSLSEKMLNRSMFINHHAPTWAENPEAAQQFLDSSVRRFINGDVRRRLLSANYEKLSREPLKRPRSRQTNIDMSCFAKDAAVEV